MPMPKVKPAVELHMTFLGLEITNTARYPLDFIEMIVRPLEIKVICPAKADDNCERLVIGSMSAQIIDVEAAQGDAEAVLDALDMDACSLLPMFSRTRAGLAPDYCKRIEPHAKKTDNVLVIESVHLAPEYRGQEVPLHAVATLMYEYGQAGINHMLFVPQWFPDVPLDDDFQSSSAAERFKALGFKKGKHCYFATWTDVRSQVIDILMSKRDGYPRDVLEGVLGTMAIVDGRDRNNAAGKPAKVTPKPADKRLPLSVQTGYPLAVPSEHWPKPDMPSLLAALEDKDNNVASDGSTYARTRRSLRRNNSKKRSS